MSERAEFNVQWHYNALFLKRFFLVNQLYTFTIPQASLERFNFCRNWNSVNWIFLNVPRKANERTHVLPRTGIFRVAANIWQHCSDVFRRFGFTRCRGDVDGRRSRRAIDVHRLLPGRLWFRHRRGRVLVRTGPGIVVVDCAREAAWRRRLVFPGRRHRSGADDRDGRRSWSVAEYGAFRRWRGTCWILPNWWCLRLNHLARLVLFPPPCCHCTCIFIVVRKHSAPSAPSHNRRIVSRVSSVTQSHMEIVKQNVDCSRCVS